MAEFIRPVNEIKEKVGDGGFTEAQLENAQRVIDENDIDFLDEEEIVDEHVVEITSSFVTSARAVISLQIKHGDDETIQRFSAELKEACLRYHKKRT